MDQTLAAEPLTLAGFNIDDPETKRLVHEFARERSVSPAEAVKLALSDAVAHEREVQARLGRMRAVVEELAKHPNVGPPADKAFYDSLNDEED